MAPTGIATQIRGPGLLDVAGPQVAIVGDQGSVSLEALTSAIDAQAAVVGVLMAGNDNDKAELQQRWDNQTSGAGFLVGQQTDPQDVIVAITNAGGQPLRILIAQDVAAVGWLFDLWDAAQ